MLGDFLAGLPYVLCAAGSWMLAKAPENVQLIVTIMFLSFVICYAIFIVSIVVGMLLR